MKKCSKCKKIKDVIEFSNKSSWCKNCRATSASDYYYNNKEKESIRHAVYFQTINGRFSKYKSKAKERKVEFSLTFSEFERFWNNDCFYCNSKIETIGLDRINNNKGYFLDNIVPCCKICNVLKNNLTLIDWIEYLQQIKNFIINKEIRNISYEYKDKVNYRLNRQYSNCKYSALRRGKNFNLSFEEFILFNNIPCHYCGTITNAICLDRINNNKGYVLDNIVSCCKICNSGKNILSLEKWLEHLNLLSNFYGEKLRKYI